MSSNFHDPWPISGGLTKANIDSRLGGLDEAISLLKTVTPTTLTIAGGVITVTQAHHVVAAETSIVDDLDTINTSLASGQLLMLQADSTDFIKLKHGTGNLTLPSGDITIKEGGFIVLIHDLTNNDWRPVQPGLLFNSIAEESLVSNIISAARGAFAFGDNTTGDAAVQWDDSMPSAYTYKTAIVNFWNTGAEEAGLPAGTETGTPSKLISSGHFVNYVSGAVSGNAAGYDSYAQDLVVPEDGIYFAGCILTPDVTNIRIWVWVGSAAPTNTDTPTGQFIGFRYSSVAADVNWKIRSRGSATAVDIDTGLSVNAGNRFYFMIATDLGGGWRMSIARDVRQAYTKIVNDPTRVPGATQSLGFNVKIFTQAAAAKNIAISRLQLSQRA